MSSTCKRGIVATLFLFAGAIAWWNILPDPLFPTPYSTVITDRDSAILGITVAADGQYRVPGHAPLPAKYITALLHFEDKRFPVHPGVDPLAILRAAWLNARSGRVVSGGSTLTMQVIRLSRGNPPRTIPGKILETLLAIRLEQRYTKLQILDLYATHAPFGGNIVGLRAASLRYFDREPDALSWAEAALLAVLPNAPALIFPGKNTRVLKEKRDRLLDALHHAGHLSPTDLLLARAEPRPAPPRPRECIAPHLLTRAHLQRPGQISPTSIDPRLQSRVNEIVRRHAEILAHNHVYNAAVLVADIPTGEVLAYVGNAPATSEGASSHQVDIITSRRSPGSILKPALHALAQQAGEILPRTLLQDTPSRFGTFSPVNFNKEFQGVVPADKALSSSLNVPFVRLLRAYGVERFHDELPRVGITTLDRPADHYGLSLILGGAECTPWDIANMYAGMVSILLHHHENDGLCTADEFRRLHLWADERADTLLLSRATHPIGPAAAWITLQALREVERPDLEAGWKHFASSTDLAWKTGTSFGSRDAWAVGVNARHVIAVWVGNASGEGRPGLTGARAAAPILFEVASLARADRPIPRPDDDLHPLPVCRRSGYRASAICPDVDTTWTCRAGERTPLCPHHRLLHLDASERYRVNASCEPAHLLRVRPWFVLTPVQEWYYARSHASYRGLPPFRPGCASEREEVMEMIYPQRGLQVFIPRDMDGQRKGVIFELAHRHPATTVFWHVDDRYLGSTRHHHQLEINVSPGPHLLHAVDASGNTLEQYFSVVEN
jgi:penicillin-binding protein 1C